MVLSNLLRWKRRARRAATVIADDDDEQQPPAVITITRRRKRVYHRGNHVQPQEDVGSESLTNSAEEQVHRVEEEEEHEQGDQNRQQQQPPTPTVTVKTRVIMKEDRICSTVESTGDKVSDALERVSSALFVLAAGIACLAMVILWGVLVAVASHYYSLEWPVFWMFVLFLTATFVGTGALLLNWIFGRIYDRKTDMQSTVAALLWQNSTASCTDISELADN